MTKTLRSRVLGFALATAVSAHGAVAQTGDPATSIKEKLVSQIKLTTATAKHDDIVTAGDVVVLHKTGLRMCSSDTPYAASNKYSNGVLQVTMTNQATSATKEGAKTGAKKLACKFHPDLPFCSDVPTVVSAGNNACNHRDFVQGEKFWVTGIEPHGKDGILISTFSDPYKDANGQDVRYYGEILFAYPGGQVPPPDDFAKTVNEVFTVQAADDKAASATPAATPAAPAPASAPAAPMQAIAPPPPPADTTPPTVEIGQTVDQVVASFGQPTMIKKPSATTQVYVYKDKDTKVTFTNGKVSKIE